MLRSGVKPQQNVPHQPDKARPYKKVPVKRFIARLGLTRYDVEAPLNSSVVQPDKVVISLKQHIGAPAQAIVKAGDAVEKGQLIGEIPEGKMGACVHASIKGAVESVDNGVIVINKA